MATRFDTHICAARTLGVRMAAPVRGAAVRIAATNVKTHALAGGPLR